MPKFAPQRRVALASNLSNTGCKLPVVVLMTLSTSDVAVCCSSASDTSRVRACTSSNSRTFSIAITAWSAKVVTRSICCWVNGRTVLRCRIMTPIGFPSRSSGNPNTVRVPPIRSFLQGVFRIGQNIGDLDDASFLQDTTEDRSSPGWDWMLFHERLEFGRKTVKGNLPEGIAIRACDADQVRLTQARGGLDQRLEHNFEVERRAAYDLEHIGRGGLLLKGLTQLVK